MNTAFNTIREKIGSIQLGILRFRDKDLQQSWQVKAAPGEKDMLHCVITGEDSVQLKRDNTVNLIQKHNDDYLFISGRVSGSVNNKLQVVSIRVLKACWFERRSAGATSWLSEKYMYENNRSSRLKD